MRGRVPNKKIFFAGYICLFEFDFIFKKSGYELSTPSGMTDTSEVSHINVCLKVKIVFICLLV